MRYNGLLETAVSMKVLLVSTIILKLRLRDWNISVFFAEQTSVGMALPCWWLHITSSIGSDMAFTHSVEHVCLLLKFVLIILAAIVVVLDWIAK